MNAPLPINVTTTSPARSYEAVASSSNEVAGLLAKRLR
jgi:hypothetical protein